MANDTNKFRSIQVEEDRSPGPGPRLCRFKVPERGGTPFEMEFSITDERVITVDFTRLCRP
ncbi:hypothetical protein PGT21_018201 [Puccinia graminis f. sp. tritici]|uniref:Uncharacterized protein n=1 Tax=Puccinia graminis f. sp. tritici TaxID=56615 RepID=A0A5B0PUH8_PUCGR|nr:hypothetical protein PGT21_018201 [Puccinia graminis f. sp. tritici]